MALARVNTDGSLDTSFGTNGEVTSVFGTGHSIGTSLAFDSQGRVLVCGHLNLHGHHSDRCPRVLDFGIVRLQPNGDFDETFGNGGRVTADLAGDADVAAVVFERPDGKIVLVGSSANGHAPNPARRRRLAARSEAAGGLDPSFGTGGKLDWGSYAQSTESVQQVIHDATTFTLVDYDQVPEMKVVRLFH